MQACCPHNLGPSLLRGHPETWAWPLHPHFLAPALLLQGQPGAPSSRKPTGNTSTLHKKGVLLAAPGPKTVDSRPSAFSTQDSGFSLVLPCLSFPLWEVGKEFAPTGVETEGVNRKGPLSSLLAATLCRHWDPRAHRAPEGHLSPALCLPLPTLASARDHSQTPWDAQRGLQPVASSPPNKGSLGRIEGQHSPSFCPHLSLGARTVPFVSVFSFFF